MSAEFFGDDIDDNSLIARLGGASDFDFVIMELCGMIDGDAELSKIYKSLGRSGLVSLQRKVLTLIYGSDQTTATEDDLQGIKQRILLLHYSLFQNGMNESHFDKLVILLQRSLESAWVDAALIEEFISTLKKYRKLFSIKQRQNLNLAGYEEVEQFAKTKQQASRRSSKKAMKGMNREEEPI